MTDGGRQLTRRDRLAAALAGALGPLLVRALGATWRVRVEGDTRAAAARAGGRSVIYALRHGQLLALAYVFRGRGVCVLTSWHRDGEIVALVLRRLGFAVARGSTSRGPVRALVRMATLARDGSDLAIATDGPRGPAGVVQPGIFAISDRAGAPIVPLAARARRSRRLSSWDRFEIPFPFSRVAVVVGETLEPGSSAGPEARAADLGDELERLTRLAEQLVT
jgi:lysophospholipid acyltransferase (LPLAT)-like uncharacterized protein